VLPAMRKLLFQQYQPRPAAAGPSGAGGAMGELCPKKLRAASKVARKV
jgi:hypothetical protein